MTKYQFRKLLFIIFCFLLIDNSTAMIFAQTNITKILILNQIRGIENCCQAGSFEMIEKINKDAKIKDIPLAWAIRYDALKTEQFQKSFEKLTIPQSLGLLLEITPQLASDSAVIYKGRFDGQDWYSARNAFLTGYSQNERKKLLDTLFTAFHNQYDYYPVFTTGWMVDAWSLDYINKNYGVKLHEITKEQYETDSYTLYGGVFNLPFYPTKQYPLLPAKGATDKLDLIMVRQTDSDISGNYGSYHSYFTSQPNDYLSNPEKKDINYFIKLLTETDNQEDNSKFAVLGLENSREWQNYSGEYLKQLQYIADQQGQGKVKVYAPNDFYQEYSKQYQVNPARILKSQHWPEKGVLWYFGNNYRARLEIDQDKLLLNDFRIYPQIEDPYFNKPAQLSKAYWIMPYAIDGSQQYRVKNDSDLNLKGNPVRSDSGVEMFGMELVSGKINKSEFKEEILNLKGEKFEISLEPTEIKINNTIPKFPQPVNSNLEELSGGSKEHYYNFSQHPRFFINRIEENKLVLGWENRQLNPVDLVYISKDGKSWKINPNNNISQTQIDSLNGIFQPDRSEYPFDGKNSTFFWSNKEAIAERSPVRLFIDPRNILGRPTTLNNLNINISGSEAITFNKPADIDFKMEAFLVDFTASKSSMAKVKIKAGDKDIPEETEIRFYPDCVKQLLTCIKNPEEFKGFLTVTLNDKYRELKPKLEQKLKQTAELLVAQIKKLSIEEFNKLKQTIK